MYEHATLLVGQYNFNLVAVSVPIAIFAAYAALDLAGRVTAARGLSRIAWPIGGALAMGRGIWSMHYFGVEAFILPVPVQYDWPTVLLSMIAAVSASAVALLVASRKTMGMNTAIFGSLLIGTGIAAMHYIGMEAMRLQTAWAATVARNSWWCWVDAERRVSGSARRMSARPFASRHSIPRTGRCL